MAKEKKTNKIELTVKIEGKEWTGALDKAFEKVVKEEVQRDEPSVE